MVFRRWRRRLRRGHARPRWLRWMWRALILFIILDAAWLYAIWPDWTALGRGAVPESAFIQAYRARREADRSLPPLRWRPVPFNWIPRHMRHAVVAAEDARFFEHHGVDLAAVRHALNRNLEAGAFVIGGSTLSQQTVKNLFLSPSRNPLRKWHELVLTLAMERRLSKQRILEIYLNVAEFGRGIYGVEAAARHYWHKPASALTPWEAAQLAATLPSPRRHNPATRTRTFLKRARRVYRWLRVQRYDHPLG